MIPSGALFYKIYSETQIGLNKPHSQNILFSAELAKQAELIRNQTELLKGIILNVYSEIVGRYDIRILLMLVYAATWKLTDKMYQLPENYELLDTLGNT